MTALDSWEFRVTRALGELQSALARETACMTLLREAVERKADATKLRRELNDATHASMNAFAAWHALTVGASK